MLSGADRKLLIDALEAAYPDCPRLDLMLDTELDRPLARYSAPGAMPLVIHTVVRAAESEGWIDQLVTGAALANPGNPVLTRLLASGRFDHLHATRAALRDPTGPVQALLPQAAILRDGAAAELESVLNVAAEFQDVSVYAARLLEVAARVCCVQVVGPGVQSSGTGFLVGPDLVMTNHHVLASRIAQPDQPTGVSCVFDYRIDADSTTDFGTRVDLAAPWLAASSPPELLDYVVVRLESAIGEHLMADGRPRGWFDLSVPPPRLVPGMPLLILQHPLTHPIKLAVDTTGVEVDAAGTRVFHGVNTLPGSSGSPCCTADLELVALHRAGAATGGRNEAVPMDVILRDLGDLPHGSLPEASSTRATGHLDIAVLAPRGWEALAQAVQNDPRVRRVDRLATVDALSGGLDWAHALVVSSEIECPPQVRLSVRSPVVLLETRSRDPVQTGRSVADVLAGQVVQIVVPQDSDLSAKRIVDHLAASDPAHPGVS